ncbi:hypothetical protein bsdE14_33260 [Clostridium omnivorum]|uniref:Aldehyde oxidase/xanthine dehydrogenase a/b hammerhead domain-containing protein n=1 Tax=Clostridium omnivorum TaxID=1604902 RepID=A0ABQ5N9N1_9CLOT|nr:hypothetical protein bsdE14_33260 [Clostridium sp. E14]
MESFTSIGVNNPKKEACNKVTGTAKYTDDTIVPNMLYGKILTSTYSHAKIKSININEAIQVTGVQSIITGDYYLGLLGTVIEDRPPIARDKVRYFGEPVAIVIANSEQDAMSAVNLIEVEYEPLPVVNSVIEAIKLNSPLIHENASQYNLAVEDVYHEPNSNIADHIKIRKGDLEKGFKESNVIVDGSFSLPQSDHIAMETRNARAQILPNGQFIIYTSSQAPFSVKKLLSKAYNVPEGNISVHVPFVGGGFEVYILGRLRSICRYRSTYG